MSTEIKADKPDDGSTAPDGNNLNQHVNKVVDEARKKIIQPKTHVANFANDSSNRGGRS